MNGKQLLHKGAAKVQQPHGKWSFVVGTSDDPVSCMNWARSERNGMTTPVRVRWPYGFDRKRD